VVGRVPSGPRLASGAWRVGLMCTSLAQRVPRLAPRANVGTSLAQRGPRLAPRANVYLAGAARPSPGASG
jgi:hypothetical protein